MNKYHVSFLQYHITFFTKHFRSLQDEEKTFIKKYFQSVSTRQEFKILEMDIRECRVNLIIHCKTTHYIPNIMKALKGGSARFLYKAFPETKLNYKGSLWEQKYFIATEDTQLDKMVQRYRDVNKPIQN
ncbi:IS200/IS605 family transposase [Peribacillus butanolivorans]|uniref:IS200/IS605 family transposase n=1 Tax=Peribacillus butanolivorans TaxID=421767 RepID=UPI003671A439